MGEDVPVRVMALHALVYCERLFYLEEVEELRVADEAVWAGRTLHQQLEPEEEGIESLTLESEVFGLRGRVDVVRQRDGEILVVEHKRGRALRDKKGLAWAWEPDFVQVCAYVLLVEEHLGRPVRRGRLRYHKDNAVVTIEVGPRERERVLAEVARARALRAAPARPAVTTEANKCVKCSLAPVCLPEEARLALALGREAPAEEQPSPVRLFPPDTERRSLHAMTQGTQVGLRRGRFSVSQTREVLDESPIREVSDLVVWGNVQITTQALRGCADEQIPVHYFTTAGSWAGTFAGPGLAVQRRVRQYAGLADGATRLHLARRLIQAKIDHQLHFLLRATRGQDAAPQRARLEPALSAIRSALRSARRAEDEQALMGYEGEAARAYFGALPTLLAAQVNEAMHPDGRSRRPPRDRFNALLSFLYAQLYRDVLGAIIRVGLEPALGLLHAPRTAAPPLALDLMELWRVPVVDMAVVGAVNRQQFDPVQDFVVAGPQVWLSESGKAKAIELYERRKHEEYTHPKLGYGCSYLRWMEVEVRLLEKEWCGEGGLFATFRFR
jgi:CRISPR-associated protein Cas1